MENRDIIKNKINNKKNNIHNIKNEKKPFNKKKYRQQKYSNKFKVNQWEEKRKKTILKEFMKDLKNEEKAKIKTKSFNNKLNDIIDTNKKPKYSLSFIKQELLKKKQQKKEEILRSKQEQQEALKKYKEKKTHIYKELSKKTKKGQPVMKGRMELLLEKIQQSI